jgi:hypothetical protein
MSITEIKSRQVRPQLLEYQFNRKTQYANTFACIYSRQQSLKNVNIPINEQYAEFERHAKLPHSTPQTTLHSSNNISHLQHVNSIHDKSSTKVPPVTWETAITGCYNNNICKAYCKENQFLAVKAGRHASA